MFQNTIRALTKVEAAIKAEWAEAQGIAPVRGLFEDTFPQVVKIREELEAHAARPEIAAIDQSTEVTT